LCKRQQLKCPTAVALVSARFLSYPEASNGSISFFLSCNLSRLLKSGPKSYEHLKLKRQVPEERKSIGGVEVKEMEVKRYTWVVGEKRRKEKRNQK
jgi:hypothetical protein